MSEEPHDRAPYPTPEDEGLPDLEDGTPEARWAEDPQEMPLPGDEPVAADDYGVTAEEQRIDEPLGRRLSREEEDPAPEPDEEEEDEEAEAPAFLTDTEPPRPSGRLIEQDEGVRDDTEDEAVAAEAEEDIAGLSPEESAMRIQPE